MEHHLVSSSGQAFSIKLAVEPQGALHARSGLAVLSLPPASGRGSNIPDTDPGLYTKSSSPPVGLGGRHLPADHCAPRPPPNVALASRHPAMRCVLEA